MPDTTVVPSNLPDYVAAADIPRLLALDAADKAKREKLRAAALRRPRGERSQFVADAHTVALFRQAEPLAVSPSGVVWTTLAWAVFAFILGWAACAVFGAVVL